jgi:acetolactate synthase small subunit
VHGLDDLAAIDALEVDGGDAEVAVPELALDDDQRHRFARHLDGVGVTELARSGAARLPRRRCAAARRVPRRVTNDVRASCR